MFVFRTRAYVIMYVITGSTHSKTYTSVPIYKSIYYCLIPSASQVTCRRRITKRSTMNTARQSITTAAFSSHHPSPVLGNAMMPCDTHIYYSPRSDHEATIADRRACIHGPQAARCRVPLQPLQLQSSRGTTQGLPALPSPTSVMKK